MGQIFKFTSNFVGSPISRMEGMSRAVTIIMNILIIRGHIYVFLFKGLVLFKFS